MSRGRARGNGEGSLYPVQGGYRGYVWCTSPAGERYRKYVKGKTYEDTQRAWLKLRDEASHGPIASDVPTVEQFLRYWLRDIARPMWRQKHMRNMNCLPGCGISFRISAPNG